MFSSLISLTGSLTLKPNRSPTAAIFVIYQLSTLARLYALIAPSEIVKFGFNTKDGATSIRKPRPEQVGQAPIGELKLNSLGSRFGISISG